MLAHIRNRVAIGGHNVPEADARRQFSRSHDNLPVAIARSDVSMLYDNTDLDRPHREVGVPGNGTWLTAEVIPDWANAALARTGPMHSRVVGGNHNNGRASCRAIGPVSESARGTHRGGREPVAMQLDMTRQAWRSAQFSG